MSELLDNPRPAFTLPPSSPAAREAGCTCLDLTEALEYTLGYSDCGQTHKCWTPGKRDIWPYNSSYILAYDKVMVSQLRMAWFKLRRCPVHTGEVEK